MSDKFFARVYDGWGGRGRQGCNLIGLWGAACDVWALWRHILTLVWYHYTQFYLTWSESYKAEDHEGEIKTFPPTPQLFSTLFFGCLFTISGLICRGIFRSRSSWGKTAVCFPFRAGVTEEKCLSVCLCGPRSPFIFLVCHINQIRVTV